MALVAVKENITIVTWLWHVEGYRSTFTPEHVNSLFEMVQSHLDLPFTFVCIADNFHGIHPYVQCVDMAHFLNRFAPDLSGVRIQNRKPNCFRRLGLFHPDISSLFGNRILSLDLDCIILDDLTPLLDRPEDFVICSGWSRNTPYNGSMWLLRSGSRSQVYTDFDSHISPLEAKKNGFYGSDQAWMSYILGPDEATWEEGDGVISFRNHCRLRKLTTQPDARIVMFNGFYKPWDRQTRREYPWVRESYA